MKTFLDIYNLEKQRVLFFFNKTPIAFYESMIYQDQVFLVGGVQMVLVFARLLIRFRFDDKAGMVFYGVSNKSPNCVIYETYLGSISATC